MARVWRLGLGGGFFIELVWQAWRRILGSRVQIWRLQL